MKKFLILMLMAGTISMSACSKKAETEETGTEPAATEQPAEQPAEQPVEAPAEEAAPAEGEAAPAEGEAKTEEAPKQ